MQAYEYMHASFAYAGNIYGATFFMATGFHGAHVIIGTIFLIVCLLRAMAGQFTPKQHLGFEFAAWYWHFVDVVWLFLFVCIYVWGQARATLQAMPPAGTNSLQPVSELTAERRKLLRFLFVGQHPVGLCPTCDSLGRCMNARLGRIVVTTKRGCACSHSKGEIHDRQIRPYIASATTHAGRRRVAGASLLPENLFAQAPRKGGTLRVSIPYNPASVDPMTGRNLPDFNVLYAVFDALIDFEPATLELRPGLAKAWKFTDPKTLVLDLVEGVTFHDGAPFNAEAVKFNLERYKTDQRSNVKADLGVMEKVEVTGPNQVTLQLNRANAGLPAILTNRVGCMVSPQVDSGQGTERRPCAGRHRSVQVRELAGQRQHQARAQR